MVLLLVTVFLLLLLLRWLFTPYFQWKMRTQLQTNRTSHLYEGQAQVTPAKPNLLASQEPLDGVHISIIIPSYNEEDRLPGTLRETIAFLEAGIKAGEYGKTEIIVVDDGSRDKTFEIACKFSEQSLRSSVVVRVIQLVPNSGKGGAVKFGMMQARGAYLLFCDADAATDIKDFRKVFA